MWELASIGIMFRQDGNGPLGGDSKSSFLFLRWINCEQCERLNCPFFGFVYHFGCGPCEDEHWQWSGFLKALHINYFEGQMH